MTIYDLLELLIRAARLAEPVERDALGLVAELRRLNSFGTMAALTSVTDHAPAGVNHFNRVCSLCHKEHD